MLKHCIMEDGKAGVRKRTLVYRPMKMIIPDVVQGDVRMSRLDFDGTVLA